MTDRLALVLVALAVTGCSSSTPVKDERPEPVTSRTPQDPPRAETPDEKDPPLGKPRAKVAPSTVSLDKRTESLLKDNPVH